MSFCYDCPPVGYPTNKTRCAECPRQSGVKPISEWGPECARGFVRDARFGPGQVIKGTSRAKSRKNIRLNSWENAR